MCDVYRHNNLGAVFQPKVYSRIIKRRVGSGENMDRKENNRGK